MAIPPGLQNPYRPTLLAGCGPSHLHAKFGEAASSFRWRDSSSPQAMPWRHPSWSGNAGDCPYALHRPGSPYRQAGPGPLPNRPDGTVLTYPHRPRARWDRVDWSGEAGRWWLPGSLWKGSPARPIARESPLRLAMLKLHPQTNRRPLMSPRPDQSTRRPVGRDGTRSEVSVLGGV